MEKKFIGEVAKITGLSIRQIRYWSDKGFVPAPEISRCGDISYRMYGPEDVACIKQVKSYLDEGFTLKAASVRTRNTLGRSSR